jgi:hypothetical protein
VTNPRIGEVRHVDCESGYCILSLLGEYGLTPKAAPEDASAGGCRPSRQSARSVSAREHSAEQGVLHMAVSRQGVRSRGRAVLLAALSRIVMPTPARSAPGPGPQAMMSSLPQFRSELLEPT